MPTALSTHFTLEELTISQEAVRAGIDITPSDAERENLKRLAQALEEIRALLGNVAIHISSGYRCRALNERIGGSLKSAHMVGCAADFIAPAAGTPFEIAKRIAATNIAFDQVIHEYGRWIHVSIPEPNKAPRRQALSIFGKGPYLAGIQREQSGIAGGTAVT